LYGNKLSSDFLTEITQILNHLICCENHELQMMVLRQYHSFSLKGHIVLLETYLEFTTKTELLIESR